MSQSLPFVAAALVIFFSFSYSAKRYSCSYSELEIQNSITITSEKCDDEKSTAAKEKFFLENIRPVLFDTCLACHGPEKAENGLRVDTRQALLDGGETGEAVVPEKPAASLLLKALQYKEQDLQMPPDSKLDEKVIKAFEKWIEEGAVWAEPPKMPK